MPRELADVLHYLVAVVEDKFQAFGQFLGLGVVVF